MMLDSPPRSAPHPTMVDEMVMSLRRPSVTWVGKHLSLVSRNLVCFPVQLWPYFPSAVTFARLLLVLTDRNPLFALILGLDDLAT